DVIYVLGGSNNGKTIPEILSIDLTTSFTIDSPPWSPSLEAPPLAFSSSGVVLGGFNNNFILVVGGDIQDPISQSRFEAPVDNVNLNRPISQSRQIVPNEMSDHRRYHTSTLLPNEDIVIIGGLDVIPNVVILETSAKPFQWRIPDISGLEPPLLNIHCAELVENRYIFIMFGAFVFFYKKRSGAVSAQAENAKNRTNYSYGGK
ncbi:16798_t:CDS:2, partial [Funneliformis geosporum]